MPCLSIGLAVSTLAISAHWSLKPSTPEDQNDELNEALNTRLSQLNAAIEAHEKALKAMAIPRNIHHRYSSEEIRDENYQATGGSYDYYIGMVKWQGTWRLCHAESDSRGHSDLDWKPLVDSSIPDRLRAAPHLFELRDEIVADEKKGNP